MPSPDLVEREREQEQLDRVLAAARAGEGGLVMIEAPAGQGKTTLLRALQAQATRAGFRVLSAVGAELERDFPFGVVRQLLEPEVHGVAAERVAALFGGAAALARPLFDAADDEETTDVSFARLNGLYWVTANLAEEQPTVLAIDDAHWADEPSMRFADALSRRLEGLPVVLAISARPAEPGAQQDILDHLLAGPGTTVLRLPPLAAEGVENLVRRALGDGAEAPFAAAVAEATGGNPLLLRELLRTLAGTGVEGRADEIGALGDALPGGVERVVNARLRRLTTEALAVARAVAVLGDGAASRDVAELAQVAREPARDAHAELVRAGLLHPEGFRFVHPLVRAAARADLVGGARGEWHRRAARLRARDGASAAELAAHLLETEPGGEGWAVEALLEAGRRALLEGSPDAAARHLRRALAEPPDPALRPRVLLALGTAEARTGDPAAVEHLEAASGAGGALGLEADRLRAQVLLLRERTGESVDVLERALERIGDRDPQAVLALENDLVDVLAHHEPLRADYLRRLADGAQAGRPTMLSHLAFVRAIGGAPAPEVVALARRALSGPAEGDGRFVHYYALEALMLVEAAGDAAAALRRAAALAERAGARVAAGPLTYMTSSWAAWERAFGDLRLAEEQARLGLDLVLSARAPAAIVTLRCALGAILLDRGDLAAAQELLEALPARETGPGLKETHTLRARLRASQGRYDEALAELRTELDLEGRRGWKISNREPTRATLVRVLAALGRADEARKVADAEVALAETRQVAGALARARLSRALTLEGAEAVEELRLAADAARRSPRPLLQAQAIGEHGAALRRAGERVASREPLAEARELAHRCGATGLEERLGEELRVAGARPRRVALSGLASLTAAERRVAELAAQGLRNRDIAQTLFLSLKTVEVHLGRTYSKLDISSRAQLPEALAADRP